MLVQLADAVNGALYQEALGSLNRHAGPSLELASGALGYPLAEGTMA
jgi:hypothetical protein